ARRILKSDASSDFKFPLLFPNFGGKPLLRLISRIAGWFLLLEVFPTTLSLPQKGDEVREVLVGQRVLIGGHVGTAVFDLRGNSFIVYRLSRYQSGPFIEISQRRGGCSGCSRVV